MAVSKDFTALLFELERARSSLDKMQILARSWRAVRRLKRAEQVNLARRLGFDGAEELLAKLSASKGGIAPAYLLEAVRKARAADPGELQQILSDIQKPQGRAEAIAEGFELLEEVIAPDNQEPPERSPEQKPPEAPPAPVPHPVTPRPVPEPQRAKSSELKEPVSKTEVNIPQPSASKSEKDTVDQPISPSQPRPEKTDSSEVPTENRSSPVFQREATPSARKHPDRATHPKEALRGGGPSPPHPQPTVSHQATRPLKRASLPAFEDLDRRRRETKPNLFQQLLALQESLASKENGRLTDIGQKVLSLPNGWSRRRAVAAAIEHLSKAKIAALLELIRALDEERDRVWCLAKLVSHRALTPQEMKSALELIESQPARSRLERIAHRR